MSRESGNYQENILRMLQPSPLTTQWLGSNYSSALLEFIFRVFFSMLGIKNCKYRMNADCRRMQVYLCKQLLSRLGAHLPQLLWHIILVFAFHNFLAKRNQLFNYFFFSLKAKQKGWSKFTFHLFACLKRVPRKKALFRQLRQRTEIHHNLQ